MLPLSFTMFSSFKGFFSISLTEYINGFCIVWLADILHKLKKKIHRISSVFFFAIEKNKSNLSFFGTVNTKCFLFVKRFVSLRAVTLWFSRQAGRPAWSTTICYPSFWRGQTYFWKPMTSTLRCFQSVRMTKMLFPGNTSVWAWAHDDFCVVWHLVSTNSSLSRSQQSALEIISPKPSAPLC